MEHAYSLVVVDTKTSTCHAAFKDNKHETFCQLLLLGNDFLIAEPGNGMPMCPKCAKTFMAVEDSN